MSTLKLGLVVRILHYLQLRPQLILGSRRLLMEDIGDNLFTTLQDSISANQLYNTSPVGGDVEIRTDSLHRKSHMVQGLNAYCRHCSRQFHDVVKVSFGVYSFVESV